MREVKAHHAPGIPATVRVFAEGDPTPAGNHNSYRLTMGLPGQETGASVVLKFQDRPTDQGVTGLTMEALLAAVIDRLYGFQGGKESCRENAIAITHLETALLWLNKRTQDRHAPAKERPSL